MVSLPIWADELTAYRGGVRHHVDVLSSAYLNLRIDGIDSTDQRLSHFRFVDSLTHSCQGDWERLPLSVLRTRASSSPCKSCRFHQACTFDRCRRGIS